MSLTQFNNYSTSFSDFIDTNYYDKLYINTISSNIINNYYKKPYVDLELEGIKTEIFRIPIDYYNKTYITSNFFTKTQINALFTENASPPVDVNSYLVNYYTKTDTNIILLNYWQKESRYLGFDNHFNSTAITNPPVCNGFALGTGDGFSHTIFNLAIYS